MELLEAIRERRSIRAFKPDPVPRESIEQILNLAILAPSAINLQPWEFIVVVGEEKDRLSRRLIKAYKEKQISCSPGNIKPIPKTISKRGAKTLELMNPYFEEMGVDPNSFINEGSCNFYGAPVAILIFIDDSLPKDRLIDIGLVLGYIILITHEYGLGTCPVGLVKAYEDEIKDLLNVSPNKNLAIGVALGYPDWDIPITHFKSQRDNLEKMLKWVE